MRRFLMIAPHFPPCRAVAAKRALCFARNLPKLGWEPAVVALPEDVQRDPELDSLIPEVPLHRWYRGGPLAWFEDSVISLWSDKDRTTTVAKPLTTPTVKQSSAVPKNSIASFDGRPRGTVGTSPIGGWCHTMQRCCSSINAT